jgi:hypothetical protein
MSSEALDDGGRHPTLGDFAADDADVGVWKKYVGKSERAPQGLLWEASCRVCGWARLVQWKGGYRRAWWAASVHAQTCESERYVRGLSDREVTALVAMTEGSLGALGDAADPANPRENQVRVLAALARAEYERRKGGEQHGKK